MILEDYINLHAENYPDKTAVVDIKNTYTYKQLKQAVMHRTQRWKDAPQTVVIKATQSADFIIDYFALHTLGKVVVPVEKDTPESQVDIIKSKISGAHIPPGTADILFTTGTTGKSKGVMISHDTIIADAENLIQGQGFTHEHAFIVNGPLNHIGSLSKIYPIIMLGATLIIIEGMKNINDFFNALDYQDKNMATFLVPASIRMLLQFAGERLADYKDIIDFIETGAAPIAHNDMLRLCQLLPTTRLYNTYASTETGIISTYNFNDGNCIPGCLGKPMKHSAVSITQEGKIACRGKTLMTGYVNDPKLTATILKDNTVYTADIGLIDQQGMLHLKGREDDVINVAGYKVAPTEVEDVAMELPEVKDCVCIQYEHPLLGTQLKLLVVINDNQQLDKKRIAQHLATKLERYKVPMAYQQVDAVNRTFNGKINRKAYR